MKCTMRSSILAAAALVLFPVTGIFAAELKVLPADIALTGPQTSQRLIVLVEENGKPTGDVTSQAKLTSSNPTVAAVDEAGVVRPVGDGEAVITAHHDSKTAAARVKVTKAKEPFVPS